jgi:hypothetical protein
LRSFVFGVAVLLLVSVTLLSLRPGGIRRQLRFAARRFRLALVLGGVYVLASTLVRIFAADSWIADWGPPGVALVLAAVFVIAGQDPGADPTAGPATRP